MGSDFWFTQQASKAQCSQLPSNRPILLLKTQLWINAAVGTHLPEFGGPRAIPSPSG
jgi:hypothetical protein